MAQPLALAKDVSTSALTMPQPLALAKDVSTSALAKEGVVATFVRVVIFD
jgi:hypothetical protein